MSNQIEISSFFHNGVPVQNAKGKSPALYKLFWHMVYFFEPVYLANGRNGCRVYYDNGIIEEITSRLEWVLDDWASCRATNKELLQKQAVAYIGGGDQRRVPLIVDNEICLIPIKCRKPRKRNDIVSGYAVLHKIVVVRVTQEDKTVITFEGSRQPIYTLERQRSIKNKMMLARQMIMLYGSVFCCAVDYNILFAGNKEESQ